MSEPCEYQALFLFVLLCFVVLGVCTGLVLDQRDEWRRAYESVPASCRLER